MNKKLKIGLCMLLLIAAIQLIYAEIAPPLERCNGNICTGTIMVADKAVNFAYTQHVKPNGVFKIRLRGVGDYVNDGKVVSYLVSELPIFTETPPAAVIPALGAKPLPSVEINPGMTAIHCYAETGIEGNVDFVIALTLNNAPEGEHNFHISITHHGSNFLLMDNKLYVDAGAPSNQDESEAIIPITGEYPCADSIDNDLDFYNDCSDTNCIGSPGNPLDENDLCEIPESTCNDEFDNDADGLIDCLDEIDCDNKPGNPLDPTDDCEIPEITCNDEFDNDADGFTDCRDYTNCAGNPACPEHENKDAAGAYKPSQCFNAIDDDLDYKIDCADQDCIGVENPLNPGQICYPSEFNLVAGYQFCNNELDDDGDIPIDCIDSDCKRKFGNCGPCPDIEDITYDSCADSLDNDLDTPTAIDCADQDCDGELGSIPNAALCGAENTAETCADKLDNDADGAIDCADPGCLGKIPGSLTCGPENTAEVCTDTFDNDGDGSIDCFDTDCYGIGPCPTPTHTTAECITVPEYDIPKNFVPINPTISAKQLKNVHVGDEHKINVKGTATYKSLTIILGDEMNLDNVYPYDGATCTISGGGSEKMALTLSPDVVQLQKIPAAGDIVTFDITISCDTPTTMAQPAETYTYTTDVIARRDGDTIEMGTQTFTTTLYEDVPPTVSEIVVEGVLGQVIVKKDEPLRFMAIPSADSSGICACAFDIGGEIINTDGNCIASKTFTDNIPSLSIKAKAEDGANNIGPYSDPKTITIYVAPKVTADLTLNKAKPFYKTTESISLSAGFEAAENKIFVSGVVIVRDKAGNVVETTTITAIGGNSITYEGEIALLGKGDGQYTLEVYLKDEDGYTATTSRKPFFVCDVIGIGPCRFADFDQDGASEGLFTTLYTGELKLPCDNCFYLYNPEQIDMDADGMGDVCEGIGGDAIGTVTCKGEPVPYASVCNKDNCVETDENGDYMLYNVPMGQQTIIASKEERKSQRRVIDFVIPGGTVTGINFDDVCPIIIDCNPDCTVKGTETEAYPICDPRCDGVNGCDLKPECEYAYKGSVVEYEETDINNVKRRYQVTCCSGEPNEITEEGEEPKFSVEAENIARTTRIVYKEGKPVRMVVVTWD